MRLYDVTEGEILYNGVNIKEYDLLKYRKRFASVFQDYRVFAMTVSENVLTEEITEETTFADLDVDSLDTVEIMMEMEDEFGIEIKPAEAGKSVKELVAYIESKQA